MKAAVCPICHVGFLKPTGEVSRAAKRGAPLYCGRVCAGIGRQTHKPLDVRKAEKSAYDAKRREEHRDRLKKEKAEYHKRTYDPAKARAYRAPRMAKHVEYCRTPEYRAWKKEYDRRHRAQKEFGPFWESAILLEDIKAEVLSRATRYEIDFQNGKLNKATKRKREYEQQAIGG